MKKNNKAQGIRWSDATSRLVSIDCYSEETLSEIAKFCELRHRWENGITYLVNKDEDFDKSVEKVKELLGVGT